MRLDTNGFGTGHTERATVCVIGSGPAGMSLAQALVSDGIDVILIEAGGEGWDNMSQDLFEADVVGDEYFDLTTARLRMLGGSSGHWGGISRPIAQATYAEETSNGVPGWPISYADLAPYEAGTNDILEVPGDFQDDELGPGIWRQDFQQSPPVLFGDKYLDLIDTSPRLRVALNSALVDLESDGSRITAATVLSDESRPWRIEADYFALCAGGIENSRLLRWINARQGEAIVANHDLIGRYWMEHLHSQPMHGLITDPQIQGFLAEGRTFLGLAPLNDTGAPTGANFEIGFMRNPDTYSMLESILCVAPRLGNSMIRAFRRNLVCGAFMIAHSEQLPHAENRITLSETDVDRIGIPRTVLHWRRMPQDHALLINGAERLAENFADADLGRLLMMDWTQRRRASIPTEPRTGAWHHMGGTRMSTSPEHGIVDADCRVHDQDNLYIGGSSVFSTGGHANPTYTIVQLALRLADHLSARLQG